MISILWNATFYIEIVVILKPYTSHHSRPQSGISKSLVIPNLDRESHRRPSVIPNLIGNLIKSATQKDSRFRGNDVVEYCGNDEVKCFGNDEEWKTVIPDLDRESHRRPSVIPGLIGNLIKSATQKDSRPPTGRQASAGMTQQGIAGMTKRNAGMTNTLLLVIPDPDRESYVQGSTLHDLSSFSLEPDCY